MFAKLLHKMCSNFGTEKFVPAPEQPNASKTNFTFLNYYNLNTVF